VGSVWAGRIAPIPHAWNVHIDRVAMVLLGLSASLAMASLSARLLHTYATRWGLPLPTTSLTGNLLRLAVLALGGLLLLTNLGISITPLLTALGVGSLAVALALQDTLSNLFAGFYMLVNQQIRVGEYIKLDSSQEGYVVDIGWRATRIRELPGNIIMIPNGKLSQAIVTNYYAPDKELAVLVQAGVAYGSDLSKVERVTVEVAREVMQQVEGGVASFEPFIRYHTLGESSVNFTVILRGREFVDQYLLKHEFIKRLHARYLKEKIEIPFPQRVVHLREAL
jgi:small-conductance mechanosensitive channel